MEQPFAQRQNRPTKKTGRQKRKIWGVIIGVAVIVLGLSVGAVKFFHHPTLIDSTIVREAAFPVYTPTTIPHGYLVDKTETKLGNGALTYTLVNDTTNQTIVVTVQPQPKNFNMTKLIGNSSVGATATKNGTLYDLSVMGNGQYLLNTGDALVFFRSSKSIDTEVINALATSLARQN